MRELSSSSPLLGDRRASKEEEDGGIYDEPELALWDDAYEDI